LLGLAMGRRHWRAILTPSSRLTLQIIRVNQCFSFSDDVQCRAIDGRSPDSSPHPAFFQLLLKTKAEPKIDPCVTHA